MLCCGLSRTLLESKGSPWGEDSCGAHCRHGCCSGIRKKAKLHKHTHLCDSLGERKAKGILMFHAMSGCDVVSAFHGVGKRSAWNAWSEVPGVTEAFATIARSPFAELDVASPDLKLMEKFVMAIYDNSSAATSVNQARREIFTNKKLRLRSSAANRGYIVATRQAQNLPSKHMVFELCCSVGCAVPKGLWWKFEDGRWSPLWSTLPASTKACRELLLCRCKSGRPCAARCMCPKAGLSCTDLCTCSCVKN